MLKIENVVTPSDIWWEVVASGTRNAYGSWDKSDSEEYYGIFFLGDKDLELMSKLANAGDDHGKFMRQLPVICEITAPHYFWPQLDQYKVGTVTNSTSKMHSLLKKPFEESDFSFDSSWMTDDSAGIVIDSLNRLRNSYLATVKPEDKRAIWDLILEILPMSYNQMRTWSGNYQVLRHIYHARKNHKLGEWHEFCEWIETLPYAKELIVGEKKEENDS